MVLSRRFFHNPPGTDGLLTTPMYLSGLSWILFLSSILMLILTLMLMSILVLSLELMLVLVFEFDSDSEFEFDDEVGCRRGFLKKRNSYGLHHLEDEVEDFPAILSKRRLHVLLLGPRDFL